MLTKYFRPLSSLAACAALAVVLPACAFRGSQSQVTPVDHAAFPIDTPRLTVPVYQNAPDTPFIEVGVVDSYVCRNVSEADAQRMIADVSRKAGQIGADAVIRGRRLANKHNGFVNNPDTPFISVKQGETKEYFVRGTAVKFRAKATGLQPLVASSVAVSTVEKKPKKSSSGGFLPGTLPEIATPSMSAPQTP